MKGLLQKMGLKEGEKIESKMVSRAVTKAQKNVESYNFEIRKNLVEYDTIRNEQRKVIYSLRQRVLEGEDMKAEILEMVDHRIEAALERFTPRGEEWDLDGFREWFRAKFGRELTLEVLEMRNPHAILDFTIGEARKIYETRGVHIAMGEIRGRLKRLYYRFLGDHQDLSRGFQALQKAVKEEFEVDIASDLLRLGPDEMVEEAMIRIVEAKPEETEKVGDNLLRELPQFKFRQLLFTSATADT